MHIFQKQILDKLRESDNLRYSELQPAEIESSHFKYHLDQLIKDGLVGQRSRGVYELTLKGQSFVDKLSSGRVNPHPSPKLITYTLIYDDDNYYLYLKDKEPYKDLLNMIGGKIHLGESGIDAANRELSEKIAFSPKKLDLQGIADILIRKNDELLSHVTAYIYKADIKDERIVTSNLKTINKKQVSKISNLAPDLLQLINLIEKKQLFIQDIRVNL